MVSNKIGRRSCGSGETYKICQVDVAVRVEQDVVRFDISVHDALLVDVAHGAPKLGHPEPYCLFCKSLARDVESQITAVHEIDYDIAGQGQFSAVREGVVMVVSWTYRYSMSWKL